MKEFKKISEIISEYTTTLEISLKNEAITIFDVWNEIIGDEKIASHCRLENIENGNAIIYTNHSGWSQQIMMIKSQIIKNFKKKYPELEVKNINVIINDDFSNYNINKKYKETTNIKLINEQSNNVKINENIPKDLKKALNQLKNAIFSKNN